MYTNYNNFELKDKIKNLKKCNPDFVLKNGNYYLIEKRDTIIGYLLLNEINGKIMLEEIFIAQQYRYKSYGKNLLSFVINNELQRKKILYTSLKEIHPFLEKFGFKTENNYFLYDEHYQRKERKKKNQKTIIFSIFWNSILAVSKIGFGIYGKSKGLLADGLNSLSDVGTSVGLLLGIHFSSLPEDEDHPFGHERIESVIGIILGLSMILTAFELGKDNIFTILDSTSFSTPDISTIWLALFSAIVKFIMYKQKERVAKSTNNMALLADSKDSRNDVFSSLGVIVGVLLSRYISPICDIVVGILVAILIFKEGVNTLLEVTDTILDKQDIEFLKEIKNYIYENTNISNIHDLKMRTSGDKIFLEFHIRISKDTKLYEAHKFTDELEKSIIQDFPQVKYIHIHLDCIME